MVEQQKTPSPDDVRDANLSRGEPRKKSTQQHPESMLDIHNAYITPQTGTKAIRDTLDRMYVMVEDGKTVSLYDLFSALNPDIRLSNLTPEQEEYVQWTVELQMECHQLKCPRSAFKVDSMRASVTEPSLARFGFLAKNIQTIRQHTEHIQSEVQQSPDRGVLAKLGLK